MPLPNRQNESLQRKRYMQTPHPFPIDTLQHSNVNVTKQQHPPLASANSITLSPRQPDLLSRLTMPAEVQGSTYRNIPDSTQVHSNRKVKHLFNFPPCHPQTLSPFPLPKTPTTNFDNSVAHTFAHNLFDKRCLRVLLANRWFGDNFKANIFSCNLHIIFSCNLHICG